MTFLCYEPSKYEGKNQSLTSAISHDGKPKIGVKYRVPPRCGVAVELGKGQYLKIENTHGTQVCDFWAFLKLDTGQFLSMSHCRTQLQNVIPKPGDILVTNLRQPILEFVSDTSPGIHDTIMSACDFSRYKLLGCIGYHDNCSDNLRMAMEVIGYQAISIPDPFNLWMNIPIKSNGHTSFEPTVSSPQDVVEFRALRNCIAVMSACPQDMNPINGLDSKPTEIHFTVEV
tara:strand:+ start:2653 stop:3339 length:687 start_codon:yes stop_codon:yes gene_type:complete